LATGIEKFAQKYNNYQFVELFQDPTMVGSYNLVAWEKDKKAIYLLA
jgi:hypothetical protein